MFIEVVVGSVIGAVVVGVAIVLIRGRRSLLDELAKQNREAEVYNKKQQRRDKMNDHVMTVEQVVWRLKHWDEDFIVVCEAEVAGCVVKYILVRFDKYNTVCSKYGFVRVENIALSKRPILEPAATTVGGVYGYLEYLINCNYKLYVADNLSSIVNKVLVRVVIEKKHTIVIDGKDIEISDKSFKQLKRSLVDVEE